MAIDLTDIQDFSDANLLAIAKQAYANAMLSQALSTGDRAITRPRIDRLKEQIEWLEQRIGAANDDNILLANFRRAS